MLAGPSPAAGTVMSSEALACVLLDFVESSEENQAPLGHARHKSGVWDWDSRVSHRTSYSRCERDSEWEVGTNGFLRESANSPMHAADLSCTLMYKEAVVAIECMQLVSQCHASNPPI